MIAKASNFYGDPAAATQLAERFFGACCEPEHRSMLEFAEQEIVLPDDSPIPGKFQADAQPFSRLFFDEVDSGHWQFVAVTGAVQTGKSLISYIIPGMYHLFEIGETVICGVPSMDMAGDKWREDFLPAIERSRYRELLPRTGQGSRGGSNVTAVKFRNGATLRFMSGGGVGVKGDKKIAGYTSRVLLITEVDGLDLVGSGSREGNKVDGLIGRTKAYGTRRRVYMECTVSIEKGRIWQEYINGSASRIALPCPRCKKWVTPEREDLVGYKEAGDEFDAIEQTKIACPECKKQWNEVDRIVANRRGVLVHHGQRVTRAGKVLGDLPRTRTFGFRWTAVNNMLAPISEIGADEYRALIGVDEIDANKVLDQQSWVRPVQPDELEVVGLHVLEVTQRMSNIPKGLVPAWADVITLGVDCGQYLLHWVLLACDREQKRWVQIVDYGIEDVHSRKHNVDHAVQMAVQKLGGEADDRGWPDEDRVTRFPDLAWYDSGWKSTPVYKATKMLGPRHLPSKGFGLNQYAGMKYTQPKKNKTTNVEGVYDGFHLARIKNDVVGLVKLYEFDADKAKAKVHDRLGVPTDEAGAILLPQVRKSVEHLTFAKHLLAEQLVEEDGQQRWRETPGHAGANHYLDAIAMALLALQRRCTRKKAPPPRLVGGVR